LHEKIWSNWTNDTIKAGEKRREELSQEIFGVTEDTKADNLELNSIYEELAEDHDKGNLDAFGLYL
jgi:anaphase-promoting complex subunit 8